ncbi:MAG: hypothetical protein ACI4N8_07825, partial [Megasphaera sp.]|uniref:hypothetical protein n=1 Tax=Megasphaera sp. TaxID=2023260 RepID=UPI003F127891
GVFVPGFKQMTVCCIYERDYTLAFSINKYFSLFDKLIEIAVLFSSCSTATSPKLCSILVVF